MFWYKFEHVREQDPLAKTQAPFAAQSAKAVIRLQAFPQRPLTLSHTHSRSPEHDDDVSYRAEQRCWHVLPESSQVGSFPQVVVVLIAHEATHFADVAEK
jgi:hypothetical protein